MPVQTQGLNGRTVSSGAPFVVQRARSLAVYAVSGVTIVSGGATGLEIVIIVPQGASYSASADSGNVLPDLTITSAGSTSLSYFE